MNSRGKMRRLTGLALALVAALNWMALIVTTTPARAIEGLNSADRSSRAEVGRRPLAKTDAASRARATAAFGHLPLGFVANQGQTDPRVRFVAESAGYSLFVMPAKAVINLCAPANADGMTARAASLSINLVGASPAAQITGVDQLPGRSNYLVGKDPARWQADIPTFAKVKQQNVYRGIDLVYYGNGRQLEYDFVVGAGADPGAIRLDFEGAEQMRLDRNGDLVLKTAAGELRHHRPRAYQEVNGTRREIASRVEIKGRHRVGFRVGAYDRSRPLVIDPVLSYSTYYANGESYVRGMALDSAGNIYLTGSAKASSFQPTPGAIRGTEAQSAVFVTKLNPAGTAVVYSSLISGKTGSSFGYDIAVDADGNAYVSGYTVAADYPVTAGAFQVTGHGDGNQDGFVTKLNPAGTGIVYSTLIGGSGTEYLSGLALDSARNVYLTGSTTSSDFPVTAGALQTAYHGSGIVSFVGDAFVAKLNAAGSALVYSTYLGGFSSDSGGAIVVDAAGNAYVTGQTFSGNFPVTPGAYQTDKPFSPTPAGLAFVSKIDPTGSQLVYSTYLGNDGGANDIAIDGAGNAYVTGSTRSDSFPTINAIQGSLKGGGFLVRSTNGATSWTNAFAGLPKDSHTPIPLAIDPTNPSRMYLGNGNGQFFRSTDGGNSWATAGKGLPIDASVCSIVIHPTTPSTIYAGVFPATTELFKSTDGGDTFAPLSSAVGSFYLTIDPVTPSTMYCPTDHGRFMKSTDGGATWTLKDQWYPSNTTIAAIALNPKDHLNLFAATQEKVYKSLDGGNNWTELADIAGGNTRIVIDPQTPSTVYVICVKGEYDDASDDGRGNPRKRSALTTIFEGVTKSTDGGATWHSSNKGLPPGHWVPYSTAIHPTNTGTLYTGAANGLYKTVDGGANWELVGPFMNSWRVTLSPDGSTLYVGLIGGPRSDAFVCKLNPTGTALLYSTYLGGMGDDTGSAIAIDASGNAYVAGWSASRDFPTAGAALQPPPAPGSTGMNTFLARLSPTGATLDFSAILGGSGTDTPSRIALDGAGKVVVAGTTDSADFPTLTPLQSGFPADAGARGSFLAKINPAANPKRPKIMNASVQGKKLMIYGEEFSAGATVLIDGREQNTANDPDNQSTMLVSKKAGKKIAAGQHVMISVRNADGTLSDEYPFTRPTQ
ncbi:MAG TPA: SBBP repeat-containing protein [Blastocatellia bacterium]|nr:SBBP repeat-containing protein [Blastocatellia bacterium]